MSDRGVTQSQTKKATTCDVSRHVLYAFFAAGACTPHRTARTGPVPTRRCGLRAVHTPYDARKVESNSMHPTKITPSSGTMARSCAAPMRTHHANPGPRPPTRPSPPHHGPQLRGGQRQGARSADGVSPLHLGPSPFCPLSSVRSRRAAHVILEWFIVRSRRRYRAPTKGSAATPIPPHPHARATVAHPPPPRLQRRPVARPGHRSRAAALPKPAACTKSDVARRYLMRDVTREVTRGRAWACWGRRGRRTRRAAGRRRAAAGRRRRRAPSCRPAAAAPAAAAAAASRARR